MTEFSIMKYPVMRRQQNIRYRRTKPRSTISKSGVKDETYA